MSKDNCSDVVDGVAKAVTAALAIGTLFKQVIDSGLIDTLPNIPFPTMGGKVFWNTLEEHGGWKLQQNMLTRHCRILDPNNVRRAWGASEEAMRKELSKLV